jgi:hypothetical protein
MNDTIEWPIALSVSWASTKLASNGKRNQESDSALGKTKAVAGRR